MRRRHHPCDWKTVSSFEPIDPAQCLGEECSPLTVTLRAVELVKYVVVAVDEK